MLPQEDFNMVDLPLNYKDIAKILPHRYPFLLVDRITELEIGKRAVGIKNVTANEPFFQGHFPGNPVMPGVLIIEAMAQVGGVLVIPGDQIVFEVLPLRTGSRIWKIEGKAFVDGTVVTQAELVATIG